MNESYRKMIFAVAVVVVVIPCILLFHDYLYYVSHLEKIEFEQIAEICNANCKAELEGRGFTCEAKGGAGYACVPPIDQEKIGLQKYHWDNLAPPSYGYLEVVYDDEDFALGFLRDIEVIDENQIKATFRHNMGDTYGDSSVVPEHNYENTRILMIGDTFIPKCHNQSIHVFKLHDIVMRDDVSYAVFVYRIGTSDIDRCVFPGMLEHSFNVKFDI